MLDSGAGLDVISIKAFQELSKKNPSLKLNPNNKLARSVNGSQIKAIGTVELCVTWGKTNIDNLFWVMAITRDVLIGRPFLRSNKAILDLDTNTITINEITINTIQWSDHSAILDQSLEGNIPLTSSGKGENGQLEEEKKGGKVYLDEELEEEQDGVEIELVEEQISIPVWIIRSSLNQDLHWW